MCGMHSHFTVIHKTSHQLFMVGYLASIDYEEVLVLLNFTETISHQCFNVRIIDDDTFEIDETFALSLTSNNLDVIVVTANVTIIDDEGKAIIRASYISGP